MSERFIVDVQLGKLAKALRILGFDTVFENYYTEQNIVKIAGDENRVILSRSLILCKKNKHLNSYRVESENLQQQLTEVINHFDLSREFQPFTLCLACNGRIQEVDKEKVFKELPPKTLIFYTEFFQCINCKRVYWKGSHYDRMQHFVRDLQEKFI